MKTILEGAIPRLIDEWQIATKIWDAVRFEVDHRGKDGQFILTGSAVPPPKEKMEMKHSGAGIISWLTMRPMTLWESSDSTGEVSLRNLFINSAKTVRGVNRQKLSDIAFLSCRGGWPRAVDKGFAKSALRQAINYFEAIVRTDISRVDNVERDEDRIRRIMRSYARHQGTQASATTIRSCLNLFTNSNYQQEVLKPRFFLLIFRHLFGVFSFTHQSRCQHRSFFMKKNPLENIT